MTSKWMRRKQTRNRSRPRIPRDREKLSTYDGRHSGTLIVVGSGETAKEEYAQVVRMRPHALVAAVGHAAGFVRAEFVVSDHYEVHAELRRLQDRFGTDHYTTHASHAGLRQVKKYPKVDHWWKWPRADASSVETAIRIGLVTGFDEIILCGCPLEHGQIQHPTQRVKDGPMWPPPRDIEKYGPCPGLNTSREILNSFREKFAEFAERCGWKGRVFSMSGFTRRVLGPPSWISDDREEANMENNEKPKSSMRSVSVLCPTRGRPREFGRMAASAIATSEFADTKVFAYIDEDDESAEETLRTISQLATDRLVVHVGPPIGVGSSWNKLADMADGDLLMMANDDLEFMTQGWDRLITESIQKNGADDGVFVAWANDGAANPETRCTFPIVHRRWFERLGYFAPECFHFLYHDTWLGDIGERIGRRIYVPDVLIEHKHFTFKKAEYDATYKRHRVGGENARKRREDRATFAKTADYRESDAKKLRAIITG